MVSIRELVAGLGQARWYFTTTIDLPGFTAGTASLWIVPEGQRLYVEYITISSDAQGVVFFGAPLDNTYAFQHFWFETFAHIHSLYPVAPGHTLGVYLENWDVESRRFRVNIHGFTTRA